MMAGHHVPFFRPNDMGDTGDVPEDDIVVADGPVLSRPLFQSVIDFVAGGIDARRIFFTVTILGDPELVIEEAGLFSDDRARWHERLSLAARHEHVAGMLTEGVMDVGIHDMPAPGALIIDIPLRLLFGHEMGMANDECIAVRIVFARRNEPAIHFHDAVVLAAVHVHIEPEDEEVLVIDGFDMRFDECTEGHAVVGQIVLIRCIHGVGTVDALYFDDSS